MACFLVPAAEAAVVSVITKATHNDDSDNAQMICKVPLARKLHWLTYLLLGGTILLTFEHMWHGEIVPWFPFLTAASDPTASSAMLKEMPFSRPIAAALFHLGERRGFSVEEARYYSLSYHFCRRFQHSLLVCPCPQG